VLAASAERTAALIALPNRRVTVNNAVRETNHAWREIEHDHHRARHSIHGRRFA
jgi:hypothetical protein